MVSYYGCMVQIGLLLETDMVPPAVMRRDVQVGGKCFALGTLIHFVPDVRTLTRLGPQVLVIISLFFYVRAYFIYILSSFRQNGSQVYFDMDLDT
jgi:hypothetical protein